jgi:hypothetical protein
MAAGTPGGGPGDTRRGPGGIRRRGGTAGQPGSDDSALPIEGRR